MHGFLTFTCKSCYEMMQTSRGRVMNQNMPWNVNNETCARDLTKKAEKKSSFHTHKPELKAQKDVICKNFGSLDLKTEANSACSLLVQDYSQSSLLVIQKEDYWGPLDCEIVVFAVSNLYRSAFMCLIWIQTLLQPTNVNNSSKQKAFTATYYMKLTPLIRSNFFSAPLLSLLQSSHTLKIHFMCFLH